MNPFEPLFLLLALLTLVTWITALSMAMSGHALRAARILRRWAIGAAIYFASDASSFTTGAAGVCFIGLGGKVLADAGNPISPCSPNPTSGRT